jgi:phage-related protein
MEVGDWLWDTGKKIVDFIEHDKTLHEIIKIVVSVFNDLKQIVKDNKPGFDDLITKVEKLWTDLQPLFKTFNDDILPVLKIVADVITHVLIWAISGLIDWIDTMVNKVNSMVNAWKNFGSFLSDLFSGKIAKAFDDLKNVAKDSLSYLDPNAKHSPSLVDKVTTGIQDIVVKFSSLGNLQVKMPQMGNVSNTNAPVYNYNTNSQTSSPNVSMQNTFNVQSQANAENLSELLAFKMNHLGIV